MLTAHHLVRQTGPGQQRPVPRPFERKPKGRRGKEVYSIRTSGKLAVYTSSPLLPPRGNPASMAANATWAPAKKCTLNGVYVPGVGIKKNPSNLLFGVVYFLHCYYSSWQKSGPDISASWTLWPQSRMVAEKGQCIRVGKGVRRYFALLSLLELCI